MSESEETPTAGAAGWREAAWAAALGAVVAIAVVACARSGWLEDIELLAYDRLGAATFRDLGDDKRVTLVTLDEPALGKLGWPLTDEQVATVLERVLAAAPRAVGLDLYRERRRPPGTAELYAQLAAQPNVIVAMFVGGNATHRVPPPEGLPAERVGAADVPIDPDGVGRRGLLYRDDGNETVASLSLRTATAFLAREGLMPRPSVIDPEHLALGAASYRPLETGDGGYARIDAGGYQFLLDYGRRQSRIPTLPVTDLLGGKFDPGLLKDRAVLIGTVAISAKDFFQAPPGAARWLGRRIIYGVELQAASTAQLLRQAYGESLPTRTLAPRSELAWTVAWCALGTAIGAMLASPLPILAALLIGSALIAGVGAGALLEDWWLPVAAPVLGYALALLAVAGRRLAIAYRQKAELQRMFSRFVDPGVAEFLWRQRAVFLAGGRPRPMRFEATVLMSDLAGFSTVAERMDPGGVMDWVGLYMDRMTDLVIDRGGMVERVAGDGLLAVFGGPAEIGPEAAARNARNAVECALAMRQAVAAMNEDYESRGWPRLRVRVGIHSGPLVGGAVGSARRSQYTVLGDTPNVAARLEAIDKERVDYAGIDAGCRILISGATRTLIGPDYACEKFADTTVRGRSELITIFRLPA